MNELEWKDFVKIRDLVWSVALEKMSSKTRNAIAEINGITLSHGANFKSFPVSQEIDGLSAGGRLLGLSDKAHMDVGKVRVAKSKKIKPQEIDGLSAGGRLLGLSGKAHVDTGKVRVAKSARSNPQNQSEVCERECSECPTPEEDCEKCMADCIKHFEKQDDGLDRSDEIHITPTKGRILKSKLKMKQGELCGACRGTREIRSSEYRSSCPVCHGIGKLNEQRDKNEK